jgi:hypothetical protein
MRYVQRSAKQSIDRRTARILKHQRHAVIVVRQRDRSRRPVSVKFGFERIFVFKPLDGTVCSLITTAKLNNVEPFAYFQNVLARMSSGHPMSRLDDLLPWNWRPTTALN